MRAFVVLVAMLALMGSTARAQHAPDWVVRQYTALNGLPVNSAIAAAIGPHGFLWLATHNGLVRFDGANFQVYDAMRAPDMQGNRIRQLVKDRAGRLYALTEQGDWLRIEANQVWRADLGVDAPLRIAEVDPDSLCLTTTGALYCPDGHGAFGKFVSFPTGTRAAYAVRGPGDIVWLRTQANSVWLHRHGHWQRVWQPEPGQQVAFAPLATTDADGSLWLGVGANLMDARMLHLGLSGQVAWFAGDRDPAHVLSFHRAPDGGILILGQDGLFELRNARMHRFPVDFHIATGPVAIAIQRAGDGAIWLTVKDRLWRLSPELLKNGGTMPKPVLVSPGGINSVTLGPQGLVWVMTQDHGFYRLSRPRVDVLGSGTGVPVTNVYSVARDASGNMWLASFGDGIVCVHPDGRIDQYGAANGLPKLTWLVASAPDGSVYAAQYGPGLYRLAPGSQHFVPLDLPPALRQDKIRAVTFDSTGRMWIGTSNGAWRLQAGQWQRVWPEASRRMLVYAIVPTDHGTWYATDHGIWYQRGQHDFPIAAQLLGHATVRNLRFTSDGALWASTAGHGLVRIAADDPTGEHPLQLGRPTGLPSNDPHTVRQDADGNVWVNSNQGVFRIAPDALQALLAGRRSKLSPLVLGRADGLTDLEGNGGIQPAAAWDTRGRLWFPSQAGVVRFDPLATQPRGKPPQPVITGVDSAGRSLDLNHGGTLPLGVRDLRVSYAEANLLGSGESRFRSTCGSMSGWAAITKRIILRVLTRHRRSLMTTAREEVTPAATYVAIDIAKRTHAVLIETPDGKQRRFRMASTQEDHQRLVDFLRACPAPVRVALEATDDYHRTLAYRLLREGFKVCLVSSIAGARYREAVFNSWDKNDPKDAGVILALLKQGITQRFVDPLIAGHHGLQELSKTHYQISLARTRLQHSLLTHYLPLYFPEVERFFDGSHAAWFARFLACFPTAASIRAMTFGAFQDAAWPLVGRKVNKRALLRELYDVACTSIGLPIAEDDIALETFRLQLGRYQQLIEQRDELAATAHRLLHGRPDYAALRTLPGVGPILALTILAEAGDLRRFAHHRQFLKYCGLDLAKCQSGQYRGKETLSKRGNARLRFAFWFAATVAVRMRENSFREKYERYIQPDPHNADRKRKALTAVAAKMARVAYSLVKHQTEYRCYFETSLPRGSIPLCGAVGTA